MQFDLLIKGANLYLGNGELEFCRDIGIKDDKIAAVETSIDETYAAQVINARGMLVSPGFNDSHLHVDLAYSFDYNLEIPSLFGGSRLFFSIFAKYASMTDEEILEDITVRSAKNIEACIKHGATSMKTNIMYIDSWKTASLNSSIYLKEKYKNFTELYNCVSFTAPNFQLYDPVFEETVVPYYRKMAAEGKIDFISGYPHKHPNGSDVVDFIFDLAQEYKLPIDIHCDESDVPDLTCFSYVLDKMLKLGYQGKVSCGHVTALASSALDDKTAEDLIEKAARAQVNITSLTSCNLYLMNMSRRGPTPVKALTEAGVNVSIASDDIHEILRPYGNCDLLEEALLTAQVHKMGTTKQLRQVFDMISYNPAKNTLIADYGLRVGCRADLVIINQPTPELAILNQCKKKPYVIKNGKVVVKDGQLIREYIK